MNVLDAISEVHSEIRDTEVFEAMVDALESGYFHLGAEYTLPGSFGMFSRAGDLLVRAALSQFISEAKASGSRQLSPEQRRAAFQDGSVTSKAGHSYRDYFGHIEDESHSEEAKARDEYFGFKRKDVE